MQQRLYIKFPDQLGADVISILTGNLSDYHSRGHTELIINYLNTPP